MLARIRKQLDGNKEQGFTLIELLVVIIIIGILAAIAIPLYLNQQNKAKDSAAKADLNTLRTSIVSAMVEDPGAATTTCVGDAGDPEIVTITFDAAVETHTLSPGNVLGTCTINVPGEAVDITITSAANNAFSIDETGTITP